MVVTNGERKDPHHLRHPPLWRESRMGLEAAGPVAQRRLARRWRHRRARPAGAAHPGLPGRRRLARAHPTGCVAAATPARPGCWPTSTAPGPRAGAPGEAAGGARARAGPPRGDHRPEPRRHPREGAGPAGAPSWWPGSSRSAPRRWTRWPSTRWCALQVEAVATAGSWDRQRCSSRAASTATAATSGTTCAAWTPRAASATSRSTRRPTAWWTGAPAWTPRRAPWRCARATAAWA